MPEPRPDRHTSPDVNFAFGLKTLEIPELGKKHSGKVRDWWEANDKLVFVTSDRQSAYDVVVGTIPGKGKALNETSAWWAEHSKDIIPNDVLAVPHPNVKIARAAKDTLPVEMVYRRFMAKSSTSTSVFRNYNEGRREIYGISFPDGLVANQPFPENIGRDGVVFTPTTKAAEGEHDAEITEEQARELIGKKFGSKIADQAVEAGYKLFQRAKQVSLQARLLFADTKYEFAIDKNGELMLIDEINTSDSSRILKEESFDRLMAEGKNPESFDKEILRRWLAEQEFTGERGQGVPIIPDSIRRDMLEAYVAPFRMLTGRSISSEPSNAFAIRQSVLSALHVA